MPSPGTRILLLCEEFETVEHGLSPARNEEEHINPSTVLHSYGTTCQPFCLFFLAATKRAQLRALQSLELILKDGRNTQPFCLWSNYGSMLL
jgi:hypothetical protein